ncbi:MAG TPA: nucleotidyltransferase family protein [Acidobacteriaceae bacterium]|jgi:molybdenum cofactor cytidylyltransferase|nr:nucleotidyltransferase family protein [Acidobacteriaceae bacterium]
MRVAAVVLAAGASTRLGEPKQLITIHGETLLARAIRIAQESGADHIFAVLGANADALKEHAHIATIVENPHWQQGMAASVRAGVTAASGYGAILLLPCDQPAVTPFHLALLITHGEEKIAASAYAGCTGVPAIFPRRYFPELLALEGDNGARHLLQIHKQDVVEVPLENGELDLDTPESLVAIRRLWSA